MNYCKNAVYYNTILNLSIKERKKKNYTHINNNNNNKKNHTNNSNAKLNVPMAHPVHLCKLSNIESHANNVVRCLLLKRKPPS